MNKHLIYFLLTIFEYFLLIFFVFNIDTLYFFWFVIRISDDFNIEALNLLIKFFYLNNNKLRFKLFYKKIEINNKMENNYIFKL